METADRPERDRWVDGFHVGDWVARPFDGTLTRRGARVRLAPKHMSLLVCLARRQGNVVDKATVLREVWPDTHVADSCVRGVVSELRKALDCGSRTPTIVCIPKRGYRLALGVAPLPPGLGDSPTARQLCARGDAYKYRIRPASLRAALQLFHSATTLEPDSSDAFAGIAECHAYLFLYFGGGPDSRSRAQEAADRAFELDADSPRGHAVRAFLSGIHGRHSDAVDGFEQALRLAPNVADLHYMYARTVLATGDVALAAELLETTCELAPGDFRALSLLANVHSERGRHAARNETFHRCLLSSERHVMFHPDDSGAQWVAANALLNLGHRDEAIERTRRLENEAVHDGYLAYGVANNYALTDVPVRAIRFLAHAVRAGFSHPEWIEHDADFDKIRGLPGFRRAIEAAQERRPA